MSSYKGLIESRLSYKGKMGSNYIYNCPECEDDLGHHLYVSYDKGYFNCFKCGFSSKSLKKLVNKLGLDTSFDYERLERETTSELEDIINMSDKKNVRLVEYSKSLSVVTSYFNSHTTSLSDTAKQYLYGRGLTDSLITQLGIKEGINLYPNTMEFGNQVFTCRDYSGRIMVPSLHENGTISFYVARDYTGTKPNKYLNPPQELCYASEDVWNLGNISKDTKNIIICEGVFTSIAVNIACNSNISVATYGKSISSNSNSEDTSLRVKSQGEKLLERNFDTYYVFYDKDATRESIETSRYLYERGANVKIVTISTDKYGKHADAADMTREEILYALRTSRTYDRFYEFGIRGLSFE